jgi:hypothetical protein
LEAFFRKSRHAGGAYLLGYFPCAAAADFILLVGQATSLFFFLIVPVTHIDHTMTLHQTEMESLQNKELPAMTESEKQWNMQCEQPVEFELRCGHSKVSCKQEQHIQSLRHWMSKQRNIHDNDKLGLDRVIVCVVSLKNMHRKKSIHPDGLPPFAGASTLPFECCCERGQASSSPAQQ